jgi:WD40 repeat protein
VNLLDSKDRPMTQPSLTDLVAQWEMAYLQGRDIPPAELCPGRPDLAEELGRCIDAMRSLLRRLREDARGNGSEAATLPPPVPDTGNPQTLPPNPPSVVPLSPWPLVPGYEVLEELGRGGMGVVYKGKQVKLNRLVALKMILAGSHAGEEDLARFRTEAEAIARLQHPNIVQVFEVGEHEGKPFFSLEFCPGGSLDKDLGGTPLRPRKAASLVETLALAMQAAHRRGIVHRDLKPANVLLLRDGTPKITDFGLAKKLDEAGQTASGAVMGTPSYMAPEQASGKSKEIGPATDVYALGAILYECLTGRPPFKAATPLDTILQVVADAPVPPTQLNAQVPPDLETICLKCLQKDPRQRYASAAKLAKDLGRFLDGEPIQARPVGRLERAIKWARRNRMVAALTAAVAASLLLGTCAATVLALRAGREAAAAAAREERDRAENARHAIQIEQALRAWEEHDVTEAERVLGEVDAQFQRTWEQRHLLALCRRKAMPLLGNKYRLPWGAISADGKRIASWSGRIHRITKGSWGEVKVWDTQTGQLKLTLKGHKGGVSSLAFSADGKRIASWGAGRTVRVWDAQTGQLKFTLKGHKSGGCCAAFSADGKRIASWSGRLDPATREGLGEVRVWDGRTGQLLRTLSHPTGGSVAIRISGDGRRIVSLSRRFDPETRKSWGEVRVWDGRTGQLLRTLSGHVNSSVAISADGKRIASWGADRTVRVWDADTGQDVCTLKGHAGGNCYVAISADGRRIASGGWGFDAKTGKSWGEVKVWDARTGETVSVWDLDLGQDICTLKGHAGWVTCVAISADGKRIAAGSMGGTVKVWDADTGQHKLTLLGKAAAGWVTCVAISPDGKRITSGSMEGTVKVWDAGTGHHQLTLQGHKERVNSVAISADGKRIAAGGVDGTVKVWDAATGHHQLNLQGFPGAGGVTCVAISADSTRIASCSLDGTVKVWDAQTGQHLRTLKGHTRRATSVAISADGSRIASGSEDTTVRLWDADTGQHKLTLKGHTGAVACLAWSLDGSRIASGSWDKTVKVWEALVAQDRLGDPEARRSFNPASPADPCLNPLDGETKYELELLTAEARKALGKGKP